MRDFPSCFGENGILVADFSSKSSRTAQNQVTCLYRSKICGHSCIITITWSRHLMGQGLSISVNDTFNQCLGKVDIKPWLFTKRKGSKSLEVNCSRVQIFWDLSAAKFGSGPEPFESYFLAIVVDHEMALLLGDLSKEAYNLTNVSPPTSNAVFVSKREHLCGKRLYCTKAQFLGNGETHDVAIEYETVGVKDPTLSICINKKMALQIKHLKWKFRGNQTILVDGILVEVFWDVHNWLFSSVGSAVFMFQSCLSAEKISSNSHTSDRSLLPWSCSPTFRENQSQSLGFSLILYTWKSE